jgi:hypothetical protein
VVRWLAAQVEGSTVAELQHSVKKQKVSLGVFGNALETSAGKPLHLSTLQVQVGTLVGQSRPRTQLMEGSLTSAGLQAGGNH